MADEPVFFNAVVDIRKAYETGFIGAFCDPAHIDELKAAIAADGGVPDGAEVADGTEPLDPLDDDSDNDGVKDGDEDNDGE